MIGSKPGTEHYVSRPDGRIWYFKVGRGEPLVFLHPVGNSSGTWNKVIDGFSDRFTCYVVDSPGHDHSDIPPRKYFMGDYVKAVVDVLDGAGLAQPSIVGDHTGAMVAVMLAVRYPRRVKKLVLDGLLYWNKEEGRAFWHRFFEPGYTDTTSYPIPVVSLTTWEEAVKKNPHLDRERWERMEGVRRRSRYWMRLSQEANSSFNMEPLGPKVKAPTLLTYGPGHDEYPAAYYEGDVIRPLAKKAHAAIKGSILKVYNGPFHGVIP